jgi:hypothetical protein
MLQLDRRLPEGLRCYAPRYFQNYVLVGSGVRQRVAVAASEAVLALSIGARTSRPEAVLAALAATA